MSETPRTDAARQDEHDPYMAVASECSKMEKELNAANKLIEEIEKSGVYEGRPINISKVNEDEPLRSIECCTSSTASKIDMDLIDTENHNQQNQEELKARIQHLEREVELLRLYGNKDCTAQADEALKEDKL